MILLIHIKAATVSDHTFIYFYEQIEFLFLLLQVILAGDNVEAEKSTGVTHFAVTFVMSWDKKLDDDDHTLDVSLSPDVKEKLRVRNSFE